MRLNASIRDLAAGLPVGASRSGLLCPRCSGGRTGEGSLSVTAAPEGIWYKCHRASCGLAGLRVGLEAKSGASAPAPFVARPYPFGLEAPPASHWIWDKLQVTPTDPPSLAARLGVSVRVDNHDELVWEVRDRNREPRGHISRTYPDKRIRSWRVVDGPWHNWIFFGLARPGLWIVEDCLSASRLALRGHRALALLGTTLSASGLLELKQAPFQGPVRVALDPDATEAGSRMARDLTFRLNRGTIFVPLDKDVKDMTESELVSLEARFE